jgi:RND family efflux transporter MFP subunit
MTIRDQRYRWCLVPIILIIAGIASLIWLQPHVAAEPKAVAGAKTSSDRKVRVAALKPSAGGVVRKTTVPCSAHWHDYADLFAKVSGYLDEMNVDIGSAVKQGQVLAVVDVPELERDVELSAATLLHAQAAVQQAQAKKKSAAAEQRAAEAAIVKAQSDVERWEAEETFRQKEYQRFRDLNKADSVHSALVDEKLFQLQSVQAGRRAAETAILTAKEQAAAAAARVELAQADLIVAQAQAKIAEAGLSKAKLLVSFGKIVSPYDGIVTARHFHRGEFVRDAEKGGGEPLVKVARTDLIRVVVHIPDRDVPYAHPGDPVKITFDALPGREFDAKLSRVSRSEDISTRTMRAEADLPNDQNLVVDQMYGRMQIELEPASDTMTLPSACLIGDLKEGRGSVFVVRDGVAKVQSIGVGGDNGINVEIVSGLSLSDIVLIRPPAGLTDGTAVAVELTEATPKS